VLFISYVVGTRSVQRDGQGFWLLYKRFKNGKLAWPRNSDEVKSLTAEQVDWLMKGFSISPNIKISKSRDFY